MIEKAIHKILELAEPHVMLFNGRDYCDKVMIPIDHELRADYICMTTLSSLVDYVRSGIDLKDQRYIIHVVSPTEVRLISGLDGDRKRETLVKVNAELPEFSFNREVEKEKFVIGIQSKFVDNLTDDKALILKFAGTVKSGSVSEYSDDGVSQKATVKKGVSSMTEAIVPSPCRLTPYRTFTEVQQPTSDFIFRLSDGRNDEVYCALYEADGGAWRSVAKENIRKYLEEQLSDVAILIVS